MSPPKYIPSDTQFFLTQNPSKLRESNSQRMNSRNNFVSEGHIGSSGSSIRGGCQGRGLGSSHKIADFMDLSPFVKESNPNPNLGACLRGCTATHATPRGFCPNSVVLKKVL